MSDIDYLAQAQGDYAEKLVKSYKGKIDPRTMDGIIAQVEREGGSVVDLEMKLSHYVGKRKAQEAVDHIDYSKLEQRMEDRIAQQFEDSGYSAPGPNRKPEPEPEPEFGKWMPPEGVEDLDWDQVTEKYNAGHMDSRTYEKLEADHARSLGNEPLH